MKNNIDEDIKIVEEINKKNNFIFYEKINNIFETLKKNEFPFQFKSDLTYVIDALINKQINSNVLSACEMIMKNQVYEIQKEKEKRYEKRIEYLDKELETYKKIAEKLARLLKEKTSVYLDICIETPDEKCADNKCYECIIDWARKEVEK